MLFVFLLPLMLVNKDYQFRFYVTFSMIIVTNNKN